MRTWNEIINSRDWAPQYVRLEIKTGELTQFIDGIFIDERLQCDDVPSDWHVYDIRHTDEDWCEAATIEPAVLVNFMGRFLTDKELSFPAKPNNFFEIESWTEMDWEEVAYDALEEVGVGPIEIGNLIMNWENLDTPSNNVKSLMKNGLV